MREVSFTEWGIQYWPVKLMIPIGAVLLILQAFARLIRDIYVLTAPARPTAAYA
jgi:TRAP-type mannitol/chloroaromatic compound transport system permease small subunit